MIFEVLDLLKVVVVVVIVVIVTAAHINGIFGDIIMSRLTYRRSIINIPYFKKWKSIIFLCNAQKTGPIG